MITFKTATTELELEAILQLQKANLPTAISSEEKEKEGFVTVVHDLKLLKAMNDVCPHMLAKNQEKVVGYALCMHPTFANEIRVLQPMFTEIKKVVSPTESWMVMGQICIDKKFRKQGIFRGLYTTMKKAILPEFTSIVTEVEASNKRSLAAHFAIGFKSLSRYEVGGQIWEIVQLR